MSEKNKTCHISNNNVIELKFASKKHYENPFKEMSLDVCFTDPKGNTINVPAFWAGKNIWKVRFSSSISGKHNYTTRCSNKDDDLDKIQGAVVVKEYEGKNSLFRHGTLKVSSKGNYLEHSDGTPFLWLGDAWWPALYKSWKWPDIFKKCVKDRAEKGFNVIQLVAGFSPGLGIFDPFGANEAGYPFSEDLENINPYFFDFADKKIEWLVGEGIVPCIFGSWGYYMDDLGVNNMKKFWKYIIARWGAYPVVWSVAGEAVFGWKPTRKRTDNKDKIKRMAEKLSIEWAEIAKYVKDVDPFNNIITVHPCPADGSFSSRDIFKDSKLFDIDMLQTPHSGPNALKITLEKLRKSLGGKPKKPVINGEVCYEGIFGSCWQEVQRFLFWSHMLSGAAGHSYGAEGVYDFSFNNYPGHEWGVTVNWEKGINYPGSSQIGIGKKFLERFDWFNFKPHHEWVKPNCIGEGIYGAYCAGIPGKIRMIYIPGLNFHDRASLYSRIKIKNIENGTEYKSYFFNPRNGDISKAENIEINKNKEFVLSGMINPCPTMEDWVLVLENKKESNILSIQDPVLGQAPG